MKYLSWNNKKNQQLKIERNITFEEVVYCIANGQLLDVVEHPNQQKYPGQRIFIINIDEYAYLVPFAESEREIFLKTIIPSRKATKEYIEKR
jgi:uncharacterized DUF497 family protein